MNTGSSEILSGNINGILRVLTPSQKLRALGILIFQCVVNFVEVFSLGLMVPLIAMVNDPGTITRSKTLGALYRWSGASGPSAFTVMFGCVLLVFILARAATIVVFSAAQRRFCAHLSADLGARVLKSLLHKPYVEHIKTNTSLLLRIATADVDRIVSVNILTATMIAAEIASNVFIVVALVTLQPAVMTPLVLLLAISAYGLYAVKRRRLLVASKAMLAEQAVMIKWIQQALGDVRYTRLAGVEGFFVQQVRAAWTSYASGSQVVASIQRNTRVFVETGAMAAIILLILYFVAVSRQTANVLPTLGLLAIATVRLVPGVVRIVNGGQTLRSCQPSLDTVVQVLERYPVDVFGAGKPIAFGDSIELRNVSFTYPAAKRSAVSDLSLSIPHGSMVGIIGPSGAGKSTLIDLLCGLLKPNSGEILVDGVDIQKNLRRWQRSIGYVPQSIFLLDDTIRANVAFGVPETEVNELSVRQAIEAASLSEFVTSLPRGLDTSVGERGVSLSGGQRQRLAIARALYGDPAVLMLDEATSSLDSATERVITETLSRIYGRKTIVMIAHRLNTVSECDQLYLLKDGGLLQKGTFAELQRDSAFFRRMATLSQAG